MERGTRVPVWLGCSLTSARGYYIIGLEYLEKDLETSLCHSVGTSRGEI